MNKKGSILIWTLMIGLILTSTFFFYAMRFRSTATVQRDTIEKQNMAAYLNSYVNYLMNLDDPSSLNGTADFDNITATVTKNVPQITGFLDSGESTTFTSVTSTNLTVEWNICSEETGDLLTDDGTTAIVNISTANCSVGTAEYDDSIAITSTTYLKITALNSPLHYKITKTDGGDLTDTKWHLNASILLNSGKKIEVNQVF